jgi:hypothetical protein
VVGVFCESAQTGNHHSLFVAFGKGNDAFFGGGKF